MPTCIIDGQTVEFKPGENLVETAARAGVEIPVFCYHPALTVVAQCRMCAVEIEGMPKLQTACSTSAREGMVVKTQSPRSKKNREAVMEFLLVNHPLDCPICDKAGECDLQDFSYEHGNAYMRSSEDRRTYLDLDMGPVIQKSMNRCIHCTRCIRFGDEVAKIREMVAMQRGNNTEITTVDGKPLETEYAGNYADICPTGSLTLKDFRFNKRAWMLKKAPTICDGCSRGCNMELHQDAGVVHRALPRFNPDVNRHWLCDEGRFNFRNHQHSARITQPQERQGGAFSAVSWNDALHRLRGLMGRKVTFLVGTDLTQEELSAVQKFAKEKFKDAGLYSFGTPDVATSQEDGALDHLLRRKSKTANLNGAEALGIPAMGKAPAHADAFFVFRGGRALLPHFDSKTPVFGFGVFNSESDDLSAFEAILPGLNFMEKSGTVLNFDGREQCVSQAVPPPRTCKAISEILMLWTHSGASASAQPRERAL